MNIRSIKAVWTMIVCATAGLLFQSTILASDAPESFQVVDGVAVYLGILPSEFIQGHPDKQIEKTMHQGKFAFRQRIHIVIALFDDKTGKRIENATVMASVMKTGTAVQSKQLEPMSIADTITYGNYFNMPANEIYHIKLSIKLKSGKVINSKFTHKHQRG